MNKKFITTACGAMLLLSTLTACNAQTASKPAVAPVPASAPAGQNALLQVIGTVADFKHFRASAAELDAIVAPHCKKVKSNEDSLSSYFKYTCTPASGLRGATISTLQRPGEERFVMELSIDFGIDDFGAASKLVNKQLGKPKKALPDYVMWNYTKDKKLSNNGNPIAALARDKDDKTASFTLAVEQGP